MRQIKVQNKKIDLLLPIKGPQVKTVKHQLNTKANLNSKITIRRFYMLIEYL